MDGLVLLQRLVSAWELREEVLLGVRSGFLLGRCVESLLVYFFHTPKTTVFEGLLGSYALLRIVSQQFIHQVYEFLACLGDELLYSHTFLLWEIHFNVFGVLRELVQ